MTYMLLEAAGNNKTGRYEAHGLKAVLLHLNHRQSILPLLYHFKQHEMSMRCCRYLLSKKANKPDLLHPHQNLQ